ncbi:proprotein convertase P-domain-containing protein [Cronbergia sp. UHCC 0137]|uniref:PFE-CTERM domain-containing protein n=1 Tax=Cronbergia sp. UHCC 0137 TaxID=3110239 RepID=UPI002B208592|nr:proprotein convertase P-domain-containing protein [Cronbergia sp. UHCC 0137]MEA5621338.1 proprotein convertase P-domain-containing protein [Cronbergia sp. UHCC 0137]
MERLYKDNRLFFQILHHQKTMRTIQKLLFATVLTGISYTIAQPAQALSFTTSPSGINDALVGDTAQSTDFTFAVSGINPAQTGSVSLNLDLTHPELLDLEAYLFSPTGEQLSLFVVALGADFTNTSFVDGGSLLSNGSAPYTGSFAPEGASGTEISTISTFAGFNGSDPNGTWTLRFYDNFNGNVGTLNNATLNVQPVPFEFSPTLGLLVLGGWFGRKKVVAKLKNWRSQS